MVSYCPVVANICVKRGDTPFIRGTVTDEAGVLTDVTGFTFVLTVDSSPVPSDAANNLFQITVGPIVGGTNGEFEFQPSSVNTDLTPSTYFYDIQMTTTAPSIRTILEGQFEVQQDITKV